MTLDHALPTAGSAILAVPCDDSTPDCTWDGQTFVSQSRDLFTGGNGGRMTTARLTVGGRTLRLDATIDGDTVTWLVTPDHVIDPCGDRVSVDWRLFDIGLFLDGFEIGGLTVDGDYPAQIARAMDQARAFAACPEIRQAISVYRRCQPRLATLIAQRFDLDLYDLQPLTMAEQALLKTIWDYPTTVSIPGRDAVFDAHVSLEMPSTQEGYDAALRAWVAMADDAASEGLDDL